MQKIKQLNAFIDQICTDIHNQPPLKLYAETLKLIESRVDMSKHAIAAISKKLILKSKKALFLTFDILQYLSYNLELPFFTQIATKEFLFKISGLMMSKDVDPVILDKILKLIKCLDQLFRPLQDFLPLFFQFQAGLLRKQYKIPYDYVSPYRPKQLKQYKKPQKKQQSSRKPAVQPTKDQQKKFQQIRQKIILTNDIINNCDPASDVRQNDILIQMMEQLKKCEKMINDTINQNPTQSIMELALAANDDLVITYRRFKDLQRNRKPQRFHMVQLASSLMKQQQQRQIKKHSSPQQTSKNSQKVQQPKSQMPKHNSIFDAFDQPSTSTIHKEPIIQKKKEPQNIFDMDMDDKQSQATQVTNAFDLMDISQPQKPQNNNHYLSGLDFLGGNNLNSNPVSALNSIPSSNPVQYPPPVVLGDIFNLNSGVYQSQNNNLQKGVDMQPNYQQPIYQAPVYQQTSLYQSGVSNQVPSYQTGQSSLNQPVFTNISLNVNEQKKQQQNPDKQKSITDMSDFKQFFTSTKN